MKDRGRGRRRSTPSRSSKVSKDSFALCYEPITLNLTIAGIT